MDRAKTVKLTPIDAADLRRVLDALGPRQPGHPATDDASEELCHARVEAFLTLQQNRNAAPLRGILSSLCTRWNVVGIHEAPYMDMEFWDSHAGLYERCFARYPVECERLHFFSDSVAGGTTDSVQRLCGLFEQGLTWCEILVARPSLQYHGYCVLRPIPSFNVSRTAITFDLRPLKSPPLPREVELLPEEKDGKPVLAVSQQCIAHLLNAELPITTPEFIQQDPHLGACATASLWVATRRISDADPGVSRFGFSVITTQAIGASTNQIATNAAWDPTGGDTGFTVDQVKSAVTQCGWHCVEGNPMRAGTTRDAESERLRFMVMSFLDSGYPVLLFMAPRDGSPGHVVATVGYCLPPKVQLTELAPLRDNFAGNADRLLIPERHYLLAGAVKVFYAHDDAYGPFNRIVYRHPREQACAIRQQVTGLTARIPQEDDVDRSASLAQIRKLRHDTCPSLQLSRLKPKEMRLTRVLVPVPRDVRADLNAVLVDAIKRLSANCTDEFQRVTNPVFIWRCTLALGARFKSSLAARKYADAIRRWYATVHLPRYVWVVEVSIVPEDELAEQFPADGAWTIDGEFVYDATAPYHHIHWVSARLGQKWSDWREPANAPWQKRTDSLEGIAVERFRARGVRMGTDGERQDDGRAGRIQ